MFIAALVFAWEANRRFCVEAAQDYKRNIKVGPHALSIYLHQTAHAQRQQTELSSRRSLYLSIRVERRDCLPFIDPWRSRDTTDRERESIARLVQDFRSR